MPETTSQQRRRSVLAVAAAVVVVALAVVLAVWLTNGTGDSDDSGDGSVAVPSDAPPASTPSPGDGTVAPGGQDDLLPRPMSGQEAIDALGEHLDHVAELNGMTPEQLRDLLLRDASVQVAPSGRLLYDDQMTPPATPE
ncbi:hypothetical protein E1262_18245 [Jiangella aurantiaca]|uniref:Uncharacterized protein n=1 Tax=Jiangella aurantiaca TaxID=2530373 RepID=A0A4R5A9G5_9ACTN|nr:hypothetical protein [Jiangella aurantiaca]TDD67766.1 hypothetical protein E1262_18245 [Jiangella aurantiaca]